MLLSAFLPLAPPSTSALAPVPVSSLSSPLFVSLHEQHHHRATSPLFRRHRQFSQALPSCNPDLPDSLYPSPHAPPFGSEGSPPLFTFKILELILSQVEPTHKANFHCPLQKSNQCLCTCVHFREACHKHLQSFVIARLHISFSNSCFAGGT